MQEFNPVQSNKSRGKVLGQPLHSLLRPYVVEDVKRYVQLKRRKAKNY